MLEQQIEQWIADHRLELIEDIAKLVAYPSVSKKGDGKKVYGDACADVLEEMLALGEKYGFETENVDDRCGVISYRNGEKKIGMWGHLDVVPEGNDWIYPPYEMTQKGDFLIGRGVQDNKGPSVVALYAMRCIRDLKIPIKNTIQQIVGCAEETGMDDATYFVEHHSVPEFNFITDCGFPVCYGEKGILEVDLVSSKLSDQVLDFAGGSVSNIVPDQALISLKPSADLKESGKRLSEEISVTSTEEQIAFSTRGLSKHSAFPEGSINAIGKLTGALLQANLLPDCDQKVFQFVHRVCSSYDGSALGICCDDELSGQLTCVGGVVRWKEQRLELSLNIRYPISADSDWLKEQLQSSAAKAGFEVEVCIDNKPNYFDPDSVYVKTLTDIYNRIMNTESEAFVMGGGTYARKVPNAVAFGPGLPMDASSLELPEGHGSCHAPDEIQSVSNLLTALKIYVSALIELDQI